MSAKGCGKEFSYSATEPVKPSKTIVFLRHGQTDYNADRRIQGQIDIPLNSVGLEQASVAAKELTRRFAFTHIFSSPLERAHKTAQAVSELALLPVVTHPGLIERAFGQWEAQRAQDIMLHWPEEYEAWQAGKDPSASLGVESKEMVGARVFNAISELLEPLPCEAVVLVISHGSAIRQGIACMLGHNPTQWNGLGNMGNCHWAQIRTSVFEPYWQLCKYNVAA